MSLSYEKVKAVNFDFYDFCEKMFDGEFDNFVIEENGDELFCKNKTNGQYEYSFDTKTKLLFYY